MNTLAGLVLLVFFALSNRATCSSETQSETQDPLSVPKHVQTQFEAFLQRYNRKYSSLREKQRRLHVFSQNLEKYEEMNRADRGTAVYGVDQFSDMSVEEFQANIQSLTPHTHTMTRTSKTYDGPELKKKIPKSHDWRTKNAVTEVKSAWNCHNGGWAFATVGNIEGLYAIKNQKLINFSEQQLLDCDTVSDRCRRGKSTDGVNYLIKAGGLQGADSYPYSVYQRTKDCTFNKTAVIVKIKSLNVLPKDEKKIVRYLYNHGPIAATLDKKGLFGYQRGIARPPDHLCSKKAENSTYGVTIVGYGEEVTEENGKKIHLPYWIIKNSEGTYFGEKGYYYLYRGDGSCGINHFASSAVLA